MWDPATPRNNARPPRGRRRRPISAPAYQRRPLSATYGGGSRPTSAKSSICKCAMPYVHEHLWKLVDDIIQLKIFIIQSFFSKYTQKKTYLALMVHYGVSVFCECKVWSIFHPFHFQSSYAKLCLI